MITEKPSREQRLYAKISATLVFLGTVLLNCSRLIMMNVILEAVVGFGLAISVIYISLYIWRWHVNT